MIVEPRARSRWFMRAMCTLSTLAVLLVCAIRAGTAQQVSAPVRIDSGRFTILSFPGDAALARSLLRLSLENDTFPGLPRPQSRAEIAIAPDDATFRAWVGGRVPEWGAAVAYPSLNRIIIRGTRSGSASGDPRVLLRHELAHLALHEFMNGIPARWFDEGYASFAAGEWNREQAVATNFFVLLRGTPSLDSLDAGFAIGAELAQATYTLAHSAVAELASLDRDRGLALFFTYWREDSSFDRSVRRAFGLTATDFEERWKKKVRRRFGLIAILTDLGVVSGVLLLIFMPLYLRRRRLAAVRLERMKQTEAANERRAVSDALTELLDDHRSGDDRSN